MTKVIKKLNKQLKISQKEMFKTLKNIINNDLENENISDLKDLLFEYSLLNGDVFLTKCILESRILKMKIAEINNKKMDK